VDVTVNVGGNSRTERFLGTFDEIARLSLDIDRNYGNKRVLTDFPLVNDGAKWTGTINKLIVGFDYTITGHAYKCTDCPEPQPELDQENLESDGGGGSNSFWQSFTPAKSGKLSKIDFSVGTGALENGEIVDNLATIEIFEGQGDTGSLLSTGTLMLLADGDQWREYTVPSTVNVAQDVEYTFKVTIVQKGVGWTNYKFDGTDVYQRGRSQHDGGLNDHVFKTYVTPLNITINETNTLLEIFRGDTQHTVTEGTNSLNLRLSPLLDDRELSVPRITRINRPFQMVASTSDNITVAVDTVKKDGSSAVDATLSYRFRSVDNDSLPLDNITGGSFTPASGDVTKTGSSYPEIITTYTAPDNDSTMKLQVRVSNELEIGVTSHFNVYVTDDIETQNIVDTNPVIENISAERLDNGDLKWTMNVSNDDGFSGLKVKWEYLFGDNRSFTSQSNTATQGDSNRGVMQATMSGYQDTDDGMLLVTVCEDGGSAGIPTECAYMNEASTSISMELIPGAYEQPIICDGDSCSFDYEGTWIACNTNSTNPGGDDSFAAKKEIFTLGSGKASQTVEYLVSDNGTCGGQVALTMRYEANIRDNGSKKMATLNNDNVTVSMYEIEVVSVNLSFSDLSYIQGLKPDNETYLCGESYWTGVEHEISGCNFKYHRVFDNGTKLKGISYVSDNNTLWAKDDESSYPDSFGCGRFAQESTGDYIYPACESLSESSSNENIDSIFVYVSGDDYLSCAEAGYSDLRSEDQCRDAVTNLKSTGSLTEEDRYGGNDGGSTDYPHGCYQSTSIYGSIWWNDVGSDATVVNFNSQTSTSQILGGICLNKSNSVISGDNRSPVIESVKFIPPTLDGAGFVDVEIVVSDNESGVYTPTCSNYPNLRMPKGMNTYPTSCWQYDRSKNAFLATFEIKDYYYSGEFILDDIEFIDIAGNQKRYTSYPEQDSYYRYWEDDNEIITNIELFKFPVTGTNPDTTLPTLDSVVFEPPSLNGPGEVVIKIFTSDNETGIARGNSINAKLLNTEHNVELTSPDWFHYDDESGAFKATITIDNDTPSGEWVFHGIHPANTINTWGSYDYQEHISTTHYTVWNANDNSFTLSNIPLYTYNISGVGITNDALLIGGSIRGKTLSLSGAVTTLAGTVGSTGSADGPGNEAKFYSPRYITSVGDNLYVADQQNKSIRKIDPSNGVVTTFIPKSAGISVPQGITNDGTNLYVLDINYNDNIRKINISTGDMTILAGGGPSGTDGIGTEAGFDWLRDVTTDGTNLYVTENTRHVIRKIEISSGLVTTFAGTAGVSGTTDGNGTSASFKSPSGIASDGINVYVADQGNCKIRKIVISTGEVTTLASSICSGGLTTDDTYVYATSGYKVYKIEKSNGNKTTIAGSDSEGSTDATGTSASFTVLIGITTDGTNLYVVDSYANHTIRKIQ